MSSKQETNRDGVPKKSPHAEREERIFAYWQKEGTFKKSLQNPASLPPGKVRGDYTFYDGPPFATGMPHYGHILAGTIKDVIPRFKTMQGYHVRRRWGWDCHGLPVENLIEKELGLKSKKDIIDFGIDKFNEEAKKSVMRYADEWRRIVPRMGRWVDMDDDYRTMDATYTESVWWVFKQLYDKGLIYEGFKSMNLCPHCGTTLSNFEVAQGYKDIADISVYAKFKLKDPRFKDAYVLAWTTTPWTLPGNVALAISDKTDYLVATVEASEVEGFKKGDSYIFANSADVAVRIFGGAFDYGPHPHEGDPTWANINVKGKGNVLFRDIRQIKSSELVGLPYEPIFDYYVKDQSLANRENGWKIYSADFVTTEDGTGVVHIAPAFGADDYDLSLKHALPFVQHVGPDGAFRDDFAQTVDGKPFKGMQVKPKSTDEDKNAHQRTDIEIIKWLAHSGALFDKEKLTHSYPHCWRCETPLLNYAASSWFVRVTSIKDKLVAENKKIEWIPPEVGSARFGNWLEGARDWAISRTRFWGAPIPVWRKITDSKSQKEDLVVLGSLEDLRKYSKAKNNYWVMRHGEAESNVLGILSGDPKAPHHLTENGRRQAAEAAEQLKGQKFDLVVVSPFVRTQETAVILKEKLGWDDSLMTTDDRIRELGSGVWDGKPLEEFIAHFANKSRFEEAPEGGETYADIKKRMGDFLYDMERTHEGKNILVVTHETPALLLMAAAKGLNREQTIALRKTKYNIIDNAEVIKLDFHPLPHNEEYELDFHRPFIDRVKLVAEDGSALERVPDVFDCWFESGSMPYGSNHYPFEVDKQRSKEGKKEKDEETGFDADFDPRGGLFHGSKRYPADFIAEGLDQTRGWFYSMLVLGVALFGKAPYKKVIVNGLVLAEDGQKMSKSKMNFPDPMLVADKYGADALRYYMLASPVVHGQDLNFSEKGVDEVAKKVTNRLLNVLTFYEMYGKGTALAGDATKSENALDQWMLSRIAETTEQTTSALEAGELDRAERPIMDIIDDLSTWYLRRSRDRFKVSGEGTDQSDRDVALRTTRFALSEIAKLLAPFMPFLAEEVWQRAQNPGCTPDAWRGSVHLQEWPAAGKIDKGIIESMAQARAISSKGLEARMAAKINVRQPLSKLKVKDSSLEKMLSGYFLELIKDEVNVKEVEFDQLLEKDVELDMEITPALKEEGMARELVRAIQDLRKVKGLTIDDKAILVIEADDAAKSFIEKNRQKISAACAVAKVKYGSVQGETVSIGELTVKLGLER